MRKAIQKTKILFAGILVVVIFVSSTYYVMNVLTKNQATLRIYTADAYLGEVNLLSSGFKNITGVQISINSAGSFALAQQISQGSPCDVFFSIARSAVQKQYLGEMYPGWAIAIASDQLILAYSNSSLLNSLVKTLLDQLLSVKGNNVSFWQNFFTILTSGNIKIGIADPSLDPAGLRGWLALEAAGKVYANNTNIYINRIIENKGNVTGEHAANLVTPLETGNIQFLFVYKSFAISHNLKYIALDDRINFGNLSLSQFYSKLSYTVGGKVQTGSPIVLYVTVPLTSKNTERAYEFVNYVATHSYVLPKFGINVIKPSIIFNDTSIPSSIAQLLANGTSVLGGSL